MDWTLALVIAAALAAAYGIKRIGFVSLEEALQHLEAGAMVLDVRTRGEFNAGHLPGAVNLPLGDLGSEAPARIRDKNKVLLLHCASGTRSGMAKRQLKRMGYHHVHNLGSYRRAATLVKQRK